MTTLLPEHTGTSQSLGTPGGKTWYVLVHWEPQTLYSKNKDMWILYYLQVDQVKYHEAYFVNYKNITLSRNELCLLQLILLKLSFFTI